MSLPAAATPVAVLVLAWDEAIPAVRALVEATEAAEPLLGSVAVLVPAGPAHAEALLQGESFPLVPLSALPLPHPTPAPDLPAAAAALATLTPPEAQPLLPTLRKPVALLPAEPATTPVETPRSIGAPQPAAPAGTVRVLHLSEFSLVELATLARQALPLPTWTGSAALPAAPYVGSGAVASANESTLTEQQAASIQHFIANIPASQSALPAPLLLPSPALEPLALATTTTPLSYLPGELPALDAEADAAPVLLADTDEALATAAAHELLTAEFSAVQAGWPQALAALREPLALAESAPADVEDAAAYYADVAGAYGELSAPLDLRVPPVLRPASQKFEAPNLNFQVIQYARFAVPVALAQEAFVAIYAPAWPTWLAAQELRYRTGRPLVLHVSTLAASESESVETATSWQAELQRQALRRADLILTETPALAHRLCRDLGLPSTLVRTVPAADAAAIAQALHSAQPRPTAGAS